MWPQYVDSSDIAHIESVPLAERGLPATTYETVARAGAMWPERVAVRVMPDASDIEGVVSRTFAELLGDVHRVANALHRAGLTRRTTVALVSPNCLELIPALLGAKAAGIAVPINPGLGPEQVARLLKASGATVLIAAGPELQSGTWETARVVAREAGIHALFALRPTDVSDPAPVLEPVEGVHVRYLHEAAAAESSEALVGFESPRGEDLAAFFHTGGTTGAPKLAAHTHANEVIDA